MFTPSPYAKIVNTTPCSECGAKKGNPCVRITVEGTPRNMGRNHQSRVTDFERSK